MIVAEQKTIDELLVSLKGFKRVVLAACGTCVTVCMAGGEKEAQKLKGLLLTEADAFGKELSVETVTCKRQCDKEFIEELAQELDAGDCILSLGCGVGVQFLAEQFPDKVVLPGLNTKFFGAAKELGEWTELCQGCGNCLLDKTGGICPIARCSKSNFNGPCGGSQSGQCEINPDTDCAWQLIYQKLKKMDRLEQITEIHAIRDWRTSRDGGPRTVRRMDVILEEEM